MIYLKAIKCAIAKPKRGIPMVRELVVDTWTLQRKNDSREWDLTRAAPPEPRPGGRSKVKGRGTVLHLFDTESHSILD